MKSADAIFAAEARAADAERRALASEIQLAITRARSEELEAAAARQRDTAANGAVQAMVTSGAIRRDDVFTMHEWKQKFLDDPELVTFVAMKPFNNRRRP
jgi:hypothetical protein